MNIKVGDMLIDDRDSFGRIRHYIIINHAKDVYDTFCLEKQELVWVHKRSMVAKRWRVVA